MPNSGKTLHMHAASRRVIGLALQLRADLIEGRYDALERLTYGDDERYNSPAERARRIALLQDRGERAFVHDAGRAGRIRRIAASLIDDVVPVDDEALIEISAACDGLSRVHTGQWHILVEGLVLRSPADRAALVRQMLSPSTSMTDRGISDDGRIAYDVHQVLRRHLAYQAHPSGGWTVEFDTPLRTADKPLVRVESP